MKNRQIEPTNMLSWRVLWGAVLLSLGFAAGCTLINKVDEGQCTSNADCTRRGGAFSNSICGSQGVCVALQINPAGAGGVGGTGGSGGAGGNTCTTNKECVEQLGGQVLCKQGSCVPLISSQCTLTFGDVTENPDQIVGVMVPRQEFKANLAGDSYTAAVETAFKDFKQQSQGVIPGLKSPVVVVCDELADPEAAAKHLIEDLGVKVILGPSWGTAIQKVLPLTRAAGAIAMLPLSDDPKLEEADNTSGQVWSCKPNRARLAPIWPAATSEAEKYVKARRPEITSLRVALVVAGDASSQNFASLVASKTNFNNKSEQQNSDDNNFFKISYGDEQVEEISYTPLATQIINNPSSIIPDLIVLISPVGSVPGLIPALELAWPASTPRPYYLIVGDRDGIEPTLSKPTDVSLRTRYLSLDWLRSSEVQANYLAFKDAYKFRNGNTPRPEAEYFYDCFWLNQYAVYSATSRAKVALSNLDGATFASQGIGLINPPGEPKNVGSQDVSALLKVLAAGGDIDLTGSSSLLDFDLARGTPKANAQLSCLKENKLVPSGIEFDTQMGTASGTNSCP